MRVRKKYRQGQSADLTDPANMSDHPPCYPCCGRLCIGSSRLHPLQLGSLFHFFHALLQPDSDWLTRQSTSPFHTCSAFGSARNEGDSPFVFELNLAHILPGSSRDFGQHEFLGRRGCFEMLPLLLVFGGRWLAFWFAFGFLTGFLD